MCECFKNCDCNCNCEETKNGVKIEITSQNAQSIDKIKKLINACKEICSCC